MCRCVCRVPRRRVSCVLAHGKRGGIVERGGGERAAVLLAHPAVPAAIVYIWRSSLKRNCGNCLCIRTPPSAGPSKPFHTIIVPAPQQKNEIRTIGPEIEKLTNLELLAVSYNQFQVRRRFSCSSFSLSFSLCDEPPALLLSAATRTRRFQPKPRMRGQVCNADVVLVGMMVGAGVAGGAVGLPKAGASGCQLE
jgi:hypothetical protein